MNNIKKFSYTMLFLVLAFVSYKVIPNVEEVIQYQIKLLTEGSIEDIVNYQNSFGSMKPIVSIYFMILQTVVSSIKASNVILANNELYDWYFGGFISWIGAMIGATISFFIARNILHSLVRHILNKRYLTIMDNYFEKYGALTILMIKLSKFLYFDLITYLVGLSSMRYWKFLKAVALGQLIHTLLLSYTGVVKKDVTLLNYFVSWVSPIMILGYIIFKISKDVQEERD